eukprot:scaffold13281_cov119-Isochrysis_galbana.AAC.6
MHVVLSTPPSAPAAQCEVDCEEPIVGRVQVARGLLQLLPGPTFVRSKLDGVEHPLLPSAQQAVSVLHAGVQLGSVPWRPPTPPQAEE